MSLSKEEILSVQNLLSFLGEKPIIFDVGSNKMIWSDIILNEFKEDCHIHSFEANEIMLNFQRIKYDYNTNITFNEIAISDEVGKSSFYYFEDYHNGLSSIYDNEQWRTLPRKVKTVNTTTIDKYCQDKNIQQIDFLKVDIEGADPLAIKGAQEMLSKEAIKIIQIEYGAHYQLGKHKFQDIIDIVVPLGYKIYIFEKDNFTEVDTNNFKEDYRFENFIITKYNIANHDKWNNVFIENTKDLGKFDLIIEVGVAHGMTTKYMCENMLNDGGRVIAVDPLLPYYLKPDDNPIFKNQYELFKRNTKGLPVNLYRDKSDKVLKELHALRADFIYIDGDHTENAVYQDCCDAFQITKIGGFLLMDDYDISYDYGNTNRGIKKFLSRNEGRYQIIKENYQLLIKKTLDYDI